jgi:CHAD domain-containing protein
LREVKALADALGVRRDLDVQIAALQELHPLVESPEQASIDAVLAQLRDEQTAANRQLAHALKRAHRKHLRRRLKRLAR